MGNWDLTQLRSLVEGDVVLPTDPGWDEARQAWNLTADQRPAAVVLARSTADLAAAVGFARDQGLRVAPQATGHSAVTLASLQDAILLKSELLDGVRVDPAGRRAAVDAGALWRHVVTPAAEHGLVALHGSSGGVGVVGYTLGGGLGWLARSHGLACNHVTAMDVVTADGAARRIDSDHDPELFWAMRGGGTHALVTGLEFELFPLERAYGGQLLWPLERAPEVLAAYREWTRDLPRNVMSTVKLLRFPPVPVLPEMLRGRSLVSITLAVTGDPREAAECVAPLRAVEGIYIDGVAEIPAAGLAEIAGDPQDPVPGLGGGHTMLAHLDDATVAAFLELGGPGVDSPLLSLEIRHLGGALDDPGPGAAARLYGDALITSVGFAPTPEMAGGVRAALAAVSERMSGLSAGLTYLNFAEEQPGTRASFPAETADRLDRVKAQYDPDGVIMGCHIVD